MEGLKRKLKVLGYPNPNRCDVSDENQFRRLVVWLEDQKIRLLTIDERVPLRAVESDDWPSQFTKYLDRLQCPLKPSTSPPVSIISWLLGAAVRLEFGEKPERFNKKQKVEDSNRKAGGDGFSGPEFEAGVAALAEILKVPWHPDPSVRLAGVSRLAAARLSKEALANPASVIPKGPAYQFRGSKPESSVTEVAAVLRLLHIQDLRVLQTQINEAIVAVQKVTANPKTDTRLGKVGR